MFNFIDVYSFLYWSVCVGRGPNALLFPGAYYAVQMALFTVLAKLDRNSHWIVSVSVKFCFHDNW